MKRDAMQYNFNICFHLLISLFPIFQWPRYSYAVSVATASQEFR